MASYKETFSAYYDALTEDVDRAVIADRCEELLAQYHPKRELALDLYGTVDLAVCTLDSLNHLPGKKALQKALHRLQFFVEPGGLFLFDVNTPYKHREVLGNNCFVRESEALFCVWQNEYTPEEHKVEIQMDFFRRGKGEQYTRDGEQFCEWAWEDEELTAMLEAEHFEVLERWGGYDRVPVMPTTQRMVYVTRRR